MNVPSSLTIDWEHRTSYTVCRSQCKMKLLDPLFNKYWEFKDRVTEVRGLLNMGPHG